MNPLPNSENIRQAFEAALARRRRVGEELARMPDEPRPGDVYRSPAAGAADFEWVVLRSHPDDPHLLCVVPADDNPLAGRCDVVVPRDAACGPLTLRCGYGLWIHALRLPRALRTGWVEHRFVHAARELLGKMVRGRLEVSASRHEVEADPEYEAVVDGASRARARLSHWIEEVGPVLPLRQFKKVLPRTVPPSPADAEAQTSLAATPGLLGGVASILEQHGLGGPLFEELLHDESGEAVLRATAEGVSVLWLGAGEPPTVEGQTGAGEFRPATWTGIGETTRQESDRFPWINDEVVLRVGRGELRTVTVRR